MKPVALTPVRFDVVADPVQQGSKRIVPTGAGNRLIEDTDKRLRPWRTMVTDAALKARHDVPFDGPLFVVLHFRLRRPATARKLTWCDKRPDFDKLTRAVLDSLQAAGLIADDARVARCVIEKLYADDAHPVGVSVMVGQL